MPDEREHRPPDDVAKSVERLIQRQVEGNPGIGRPLPDRVRQMQRTAEAYLSHGAPPRWMERIREIDRGVERERQRLERDYRALREECAGDRALFRERWRALARRRRYDDLNELIDQHNEWYPIERDLPLDPRTGDYVRVHGRSYRRPHLGADWILERFPAGGDERDAAA